MTKTPDTTLSLGMDESLVLRTPMPKIRVKNSVDPVVLDRPGSEKDKGVKSYLVYVLLLIQYGLLMCLMLKKPESLDLSTLIREIDLLKEENNKMSEFIGRMRVVKKEVNHARIERGAKVRIKDADSMYLYGMLGFRRHRDPNTILDENVSIGECLAFKGSKFRFTIEFNNEVEINKVGIFHPITTDMSSAIDEFEVFSNTDEGHVLLGRFKYNTIKCEFQTFELEETTVNSVDFVVASNNGHKEYTCVYKVYVFGTE